MTNADKADLRRLVRTRPDLSNAELAYRCDCAPATAARYRRALAGKPFDPRQPAERAK